MARPNYGYEKRQRELAKKRKKDEKNAKKASDLEAGAAAASEPARTPPQAPVVEDVDGKVATEPAPTA